jgi:Family of unknown function (DUF5677)
MPTHPTTKRVLVYIQRLEDYLNGLEMIPATRYYRNAVLLASLSKILTVSRAICVLIDAGYPAEAFGLSRTLIEIYFCVRYIGNKNTEQRAETYVNYHARVRQEWQTIIMKYYPHTPSDRIRLDSEVLDVAKKFRSKAHWTGSGGQAKLMALEEDSVEVDEQGQPFKSEFDYDALYFWTSHFVHATVVGVEAHASPPGEVFKVRARSFTDVERAKDSLFNITVFLCKTFVVALRAMNEDQPDVLQRLHKLIAKFAYESKTSRSVDA